MLRCSTNQTILTSLDGSLNFSADDKDFKCSMVNLGKNSLQTFLMTKIAPYIIILTVVTNVLICIVLTRRHMVSPTNIILLAMAIADMLTGLFPLPIYIAKNFDSFYVPVTVPKAYAHYYLTLFFPTIFHTASIWLTVTLAVQRFIYVTFPVRVAQICTVKNSIIATVITYIAACLFHIFSLGTTFQEFTQYCAETGNSSVVVYKCTHFSRGTMMFYNGARVVLINVIPCLSLGVFTVLLMVALQRAESKRRKLLNKTNESGVKESNSTSKMLLVVLISFMIVELPTGVIISVYMATVYLKINLKIPWVKLTATSNIFILVSYPFNFFIYCGMSQQFRNTFRALFGLPTPASGNNATQAGAATRSQYVALRGSSVKNGNGVPPDSNEDGTVEI